MEYFMEINKKQNAICIANKIVATLKQLPVAERQNNLSA
jgi:hypothetical protein